MLKFSDTVGTTNSLLMSFTNTRKSQCGKEIQLSFNDLEFKEIVFTIHPLAPAGVRNAN